VRVVVEAVAVLAERRRVLHLPARVRHVQGLAERVRVQVRNRDHPALAEAPHPQDGELRLAAAVERPRVDDAAQLLAVPVDHRVAQQPAAPHPRSLRRMTLAQISARPAGGSTGSGP
jgi:hypothetical protein